MAVSVLERLSQRVANTVKIGRPIDSGVGCIEAQEDLIEGSGGDLCVAPRVPSALKAMRRESERNIDQNDPGLFGAEP